MAVSDIVVMNVGGKPQVTFHVATDSGPVTDLTFDACRFYLADLVPAGTATATQGTWASDYFERWAYERSNTTGAVFDDSDAANGNYTFTFVTGFGSADALAEAPEYDPTHEQRLVIRVSGTEGVTQNTVGIFDLTAVPAAGAAATEVPAANQRMYASIDGCKNCHGPQMEGAAHANGYLDTRACVVCHSPIGHYGDEMVPDEAYLSVFIHKIHSALPVAGFLDRHNNNGLKGEGYVDVTYPQEVKNCTVCHVGTSDQVDNWETHPTIEVCTSCHSTTTFSGTSPTHSGGAQANGSCLFCHSAGGLGKGVAEAHDTTPTGIDAPEFDVTLTLSDPANGTNYVAGETFTVTATLVDHATGAAVDPTLYTTAQDAAYVAGGGLHVASLYAYGPRSESVPLMTNAGAFQQALSLFSGTLAIDNATVTTSASGFSASVTIPADATAGTYMIRTRFADYSFDRNNAAPAGQAAYQAESYALKRIQIGTTTVEPKVSGNACVECHGATQFHLNDHAAPFDTDHCLACHDKSGGHADYIGNRVHAVHRATVTGDISLSGGVPRLWADVTFPQTVNKCTICHTNLDAPTPVWETPDMIACGGCHGANAGLDPTDPRLFVDEDGNAIDPVADAAEYADRQAQVTREIGAAQHMVQNGGSTDSTVPPTLSCLTCHGQGKIADLFDTHRLITFPPPIVPPSDEQ